MTIPRSRSDDIFTIFFTVISTIVVTFFVVFALIDICHGESLIASSLWLALVALKIRWALQHDGGLRKLLINMLGDMGGRRFAEVGLAETQSPVIHFGFHLFGRCFIQKTIYLHDIESVEWNTGQGTYLAGRDMNDWHVVIWFDHHDPKKSEQKSTSWKADQDLYLVGLSGHKDKTEAFGLSLVAFLREAGAALIPSPMPTRFIRRQLLPDHCP